MHPLPGILQRARAVNKWSVIALSPSNFPTLPIDQKSDPPSPAYPLGHAVTHRTPWQQGLVGGGAYAAFTSVIAGAAPLYPPPRSMGGHHADTPKATFMTQGASNDGGLTRHRVEGTAVIIGQHAERSTARG